jgi:hypothetical protein
MAYKRWYMGWGSKGGEEASDSAGGWAERAEQEAQDMIEAAEEAEEQRQRGGATQQSILHQARECWRGDEGLP